jgi:hypothetical protein
MVYLASVAQLSRHMAGVPPLRLAEFGMGRADFQNR